MKPRRMRLWNGFRRDGLADEMRAHPEMLDVLLGYIIEIITGGTYEKFVTENLFQPLGMKDTGYDSNTKIIPRRAGGYSATPNGYVHAGFVDMSVPHAAGALYSTTEDLLKWQQGLFGGKVLQPESLRKMAMPFLDGSVWTASRCGPSMRSKRPVMRGRHENWNAKSATSCSSALAKSR